MKILGIETSCDETAAAVVEDGKIILSNVVATSAEIHVKTGGIVPEQAARQQVKSIIPVVKQALLDAFPQKGNNILEILKEIDAIAVTVGPGLIGSLLVGVETAKTLSFLWKKPIIPVNHLVAHIYANWLLYERLPNGKMKKLKDSNKLPHFPALALVVSGGHTDIVLLKDHGKIEWLGGTLDDAAGEAFDKCARILGLPYPGGPAISKEAEKYFNSLPKNTEPKLNLFPRPLLNKKNSYLSFSGLKTAVLRSIKEKKLTPDEVSRLAAEVQEAIVDSLLKKTIRLAKIYRPKSLILAGGVSANLRLRKKFFLLIKSEKLQDFHVPKSGLCTDNASYVAAFAFYNFRPVDWKKNSAKPDLTITGEP